MKAHPMSPDDKTSIVHAAIAWLGVFFTHSLHNVGIQNWADLSAMLVSVYTMFLIVRFIWRAVMKRRLDFDDTRR